MLGTRIPEFQFQALPFTRCVAWKKFLNLCVSVSLSVRMWIITISWVNSYKAPRHLEDVIRVHCCLHLLSTPPTWESIVGQNPLPFRLQRANPYWSETSTAGFRISRPPLALVFPHLLKWAFLIRAPDPNCLKRHVSWDWVSGTVRCCHCFFPILKCRSALGHALTCTTCPVTFLTRYVRPCKNRVMMERTGFTFCGHSSMQDVFIKWGMASFFWAWARGVEGKREQLEE